MSIASNLQQIKSSIPHHVMLVAVSKTKSNAEILEAYAAGQRVFGENRVQELVLKYEALPKDIQWHLIGHLQTNKVKEVVPFVKVIESVDSIKLLKEINKEAQKISRVIDCLLEIRIAKEETKFGMSVKEAEDLLCSEEFGQFNHVRITGLMGIATLTQDQEQIRQEFTALQQIFNKLKTTHPKLQTLSMGMSSDYPLAIEEGSNTIRVGSMIFGERIVY